MSDRSTSSTSPTTTSSGSPSGEPKQVFASHLRSSKNPEPPASLRRCSGKRRKREDGSSFKRRGKVLDVLRRQPEVLDLGRTNAVLMREQMAMSLTMHLIHKSNGWLNIPITSVPVMDLGVLFGDYLKQGWRSRDRDPRRDCMIACLVALGSRRSDHSFVTGVSEPTGSDYSPNVELGWKREAVCRSLARRAVELAEECNLLQDASPEAMEVTALLRVALYSSDPTHPHTIRLAAQLHKSHSVNTPSDPSRSADFSHVSPLGYDFWLAILNRTRPQVSEKALAGVYKWDRDKVPTALKLVKTLKGGREHGIVVATGLIRDLVSLQQLPDCSLADLPKLTLLIGGIFEALDALEEVATTVKNNVPEGYPFGMSSVIGTIPMLGECVLAYDVDRVVKNMAKTQPKVKELVLLTRMRFVSWLKTFTRFIDIPQFTQDAASRHTLALRLLTLEVFPGWMKVVVEAARQHNAGEGPYAAVGYAWEDLKRLQTLLACAATVFAKSSEQYSDITDAMSKLNITSFTTELVMLDEDIRVTSLAHSMVLSAISEITTVE